MDWDRLEMLTAFRRIRHQPDPLQIVLDMPKDLQCELPDLPVLCAKLTNLDVDHKEITYLSGCDYRSGRRVRFAMEVRDKEGRMLPWNEEFLSGMGGGVGGGRTLKFGESEDYHLPLIDYVAIDAPGTYTVTVLYAAANIADLRFTDGFIVHHSKPYTFTVAEPLPKRSREMDQRVHSLVSSLPEKGPVLMVDGRYGKWLYGEIDPKSPAGMLLALGRSAVLPMIDELDAPEITPQRRAWLLALLFSVTGCNDPRGPRGTKWSFSHRSADRLRLLDDQPLVWRHDRRRGWRISRPRVRKHTRFASVPAVPEQPGIELVEFMECVPAYR